MTSLAEWPLDQAARVVRVLGDGEVSCRLLEMGLTPGVEVRIVGTAPWGDPLELDVRNYRLSLRRSEAALVEVERP
ncbi:MAG: ferrous iron transport protein A [Isosphaeraceae bacterium]|nr:ferrous iron transport protein A [Isosphaeraceae bacterium]